MLQGHTHTGAGKEICSLHPLAQMKFVSSRNRFTPTHKRKKYTKTVKSEPNHKTSDRFPGAMSSSITVC